MGSIRDNGRNLSHLARESVRKLSEKDVFPDVVMHGPEGDRIKPSGGVRLAGNSNDRTPHLVARSASGNSIFVGVIHRTDPADPQSKAFGNLVHDWLEQTKGRDRIFLTEGKVHEPGPTEEASLAANSDTGRLAYLAKEHGVPIKSLEEDYIDQAHWVISEKGHNPEDVFAYYILRRIPQALRAQEGHRPNMAEHLQETFDMHSPMLPAGADPGEVFERAMRRLFPERKKSPFEWDASDEDFLLRQTVDFMSGGPVDTPIQRVSADVNHRREVYATQVIREEMAAGREVFAIFGEPHVDPMLPMMKREFPVSNLTELADAA